MNKLIELKHEVLVGDKRSLWSVMLDEMPTIQLKDMMLREFLASWYATQAAEVSGDENDGQVVYRGARALGMLLELDIEVFPKLLEYFDKPTYNWFWYMEMAIEAAYMAERLDYLEMIDTDILTPSLLEDLTDYIEELSQSD